MHVRFTVYRQAIDVDRLQATTRTGYDAHGCWCLVWVDAVLERLDLLVVPRDELWRISLLGKVRGHGRVVAVVVDSIGMRRESKKIGLRRHGELKRTSKEEDASRTKTAKRDRMKSYTRQDERMREQEQVSPQTKIFQRLLLESLSHVHSFSATHCP